MKTQNEMKQIARKATKITGETWQLSITYSSENKREYWLQSESGEQLYWDEIPPEWEKGIEYSKAKGKMNI